MNLDAETRRQIDDTRSMFEFLTYLVMDDDIVLGIVQNETPKVMMIYEIGKIKDKKTKEEFLQYGDEWWWGSNQSVPIDSFIGDRFQKYQHCLTGYPKKSISDIIGPTFNLAERYLKRVKRKRVGIVNTDRKSQ